MFLRPCLHSKWMSWKHVERWQRCLAANKPVLKTFRNRSAHGLSFWQQVTHGWNEFLAHAGIPTRPNSLDSVYLIHIYPYLAYLHITNNNNYKYLNTTQIKSCSNLSQKKRLRPSDRQVGDGASSGSRSRSQSRMGQLLIPDWLPAVTNPLLSHSERGVWRIISRVKSFVIMWSIYYTYVCFCDDAHTHT